MDNRQLTIKNMENAKGQIIVTLILVMTVALAIGLSIIQKSLVDVSTATKVEQSSRAFSAAEAGIEKALKSINCGAGGVNCSVTFSENNSSATVNDSNLIPAVPPVGTQQSPLEYPPLAKEDVAHFWLADLDSTDPSNPPLCGPSISCYYTKPTLDVYWGNSTTDRAALELTLVYYGTNPTDPVDPSAKYRNRKWYLDQFDRNNNFHQGCGYTSSSSVENYTCKFTIGGTQDPNGSLPAGLILLRGRLLYNTTSQPIAIQAIWPCSGNGCFIPSQARVLVSSGVSGETQRKVKLFQLNKVVPPYFDYAIFSAGEIRK